MVENVEQNINAKNMMANKKSQKSESFNKR